jgi:hypothetical protein
LQNEKYVKYFSEDLVTCALCLRDIRAKGRNGEKFELNNWERHKRCCSSNCVSGSAFFQRILLMIFSRGKNAARRLERNRLGDDLIFSLTKLTI